MAEDLFFFGLHSRPAVCLSFCGLSTVDNWFCTGSAEVHTYLRTVCILLFLTMADPVADVMIGYKLIKKQTKILQSLFITAQHLNI